MSADPNFEFLGQRLLIPTTIPGVVGLCGVLTAIVFIVYFIVAGCEEVMTHGNPQNIGALTSFVTSKQISNENGKAEVRQEDADTKLVGFWTPSADTQTDLTQQSADRQIASEDRWQVVPEQKVDEFENNLWNQFGDGKPGAMLHGLRRYQTTGHGLTTHKRGWWWTLNVDRRFDSRQLAKFYFSFWQNSKQMYVEEINGKSEYE